MIRFTDLPMSRKLMRMSIIVSLSVLLLACAAFTIYEIFTFQKTAAEQLSAQADIVGINSTPAILFNDQDAASETLASLRATANVTSAAIYLADGKLFARYLRETEIAQEALPESLPASDESPLIEGKHLSVRSRVMSDGNLLGVVYIRSDLEEITTRLQGYGLIAVAIFVVSFLVTLPLSREIEKRISGPILKLADTAGSIAAGRLEARSEQPYSNDEIGAVARAFDSMAETLATQIAALRDKEERLREQLVRIERAEQRVRQQLEHMQSLDRITRSIAERLDLQSIFQIVVGTLEESLPVDFCCIALHDPPSDTLRIGRFGTKSAELAEALGLTQEIPFGVQANGLTDCMDGRLVYEPDLGRARFPLPEGLARGGLRSLVLAPLRSESRVFGILLAARREQDGFGSSECEFLRQLTEHVALAAGQAQLHGALQQAYDDLRQTQQVVMQEERLRALGQMASGIAHDINNALSPVTLYTESLLETEAGLSARGRGYLQTIQRAVEDVAETVARMREFYRQREAQIALSSMDANELVRQVIDLTRARWRDMPQQHGIAITAVAELAPGLPKILGIESEIREALTNLVFNAVDAMPKGGTITLRTRVTESANGAQPDAVAIEVEDQGVGMDEETRRRCLEPFFTTKGERGTGLGLAMVFGAMQRHGAELQIDSSPGVGTTVRLVFPVPRDGTVESGKASNAPEIASQLRLLLIDDDPVLLKSLRDTLENDGHVIVTASGGREGIAAFQAALESGASYAAVITDLGMPHVDGRKVAATVKEASPSTPVIMLTGWGQRLIAEGDIPPFVDRVLPKPPKLRDLREALVELCRARPSAQA